MNSLIFPPSINSSLGQNSSSLMRQIHSKINLFTQTSQGAVITLIALTIISFEIAVTICKAGGYLYQRVTPMKKGEGGNVKSANLLRLINILFCSILGGIIYATNRMLQLPLSTKTFILTGSASGLVYLCLRKSKVEGKGDNTD